MMTVSDGVTFVGFISTTIFGVAIGLGFSIGSALYDLIGSLFRRPPPKTT